MVPARATHAHHAPTRQVDLNGPTRRAVLKVHDHGGTDGQGKQVVVVDGVGVDVWGDPGPRCVELQTDLIRSATAGVSRRGSRLEL